MSEKKKSAEASRNEAELMDQLLAGCEGAEDVFGPGGAFNELRKRLIERMLHTELSSHLGYEKGQKAPDSVAAEGNHRNGYSSKKVMSEDGPLELAIPRERLGTFEPQLIRKGQRRGDAFDRRIISLYARGMTVREIQGFLVDQYGLEVSPDFISAATEGVMDEVTAWQNRPLETLYPSLESFSSRFAPAAEDPLCPTLRYARHTRYG